MRIALVLALVVVAVEFVASAPFADAKAKVLARIQQLQQEKGVQKADEERDFTGTDAANYKDWLIFVSLVGKCEVSRRVHELYKADYSEYDILGFSCPTIYEIGSYFHDATEEEIAEASRFIRHYSHEFQCVSYFAEVQNILFFMWEADGNLDAAENDPYLQASAFTSDFCSGALDALVQDDFAEFDNDLDRLEAVFEGDKRKVSLTSMLRELLKTTAKKR